MITPHDILWGVIFPAILAVIATLVSHLPLRRDAKTRPWGLALAVTGGFALAFVGITGMRALKPATAEGWLIHFGGGAVLISVIGALVPRRASALVTMPLGVALLAAAALFIVRPRGDALPNQQRWIIVAGVVVWFVLVELLASKAAGAGLPLLLALFAGCAAPILINAHSQSLGQFAGGIAVVLAVIGFSGLWFRNLSLAGGGALAIAVVLIGVIVCGFLYADLSPRDTILATAAPLALWIGQVIPKRRPLLRFTASGIAMMLILSIPLVPALKGLHQTMQEQTESYNY